MDKTTDDLVNGRAIAAEKKVSRTILMARETAELSPISAPPPLSRSMNLAAGFSGMVYRRSKSNTWGLCCNSWQVNDLRPTSVTARQAHQAWSRPPLAS